MRSYHQFCPVAKAAEVFCERWTALIVRDLAGGERRFSDLQRGVPLVSPTLLSRRLKQLEAEGVVVRRRSTGRGSTYRLSKSGEEFVPVVLALGTWGQRWTRRALAEHEIDLGLLLWALEQGAHPGCFGDARTVVEIELVDQPLHKRRWWFLNENGRCELCLKQPDREAQLYVTVSLRDLVLVGVATCPCRLRSPRDASRFMAAAGCVARSAAGSASACWPTSGRRAATSGRWPARRRTKPRPNTVHLRTNEASPQTAEACRWFRAPVHDGLW